ncbi:MAG: phosphoribosylglycinamide formyltransferase [Alphaproteobacteria bacterium]
MIKKRVAVLISGNGSNLQALIDAARAADYPAEISLVISNKEDAHGLSRAKNANITSLVIRHTDYESRAAFDTAMQKELQAHAIDILCLAGFMRLLSDGFVNAWHGRMLNIHPSLLPQFKGAHAVRDALEAGVQETGCTVHLVTPEMDSGPILAQAQVAVFPDDSYETLRARIHAQEHILYPKALKQLIEKR